jgi:predicted AAA+ superfamily ATPase
VKDLGQFQTFLKMCASRVGQILNLSALALDCGLSHNTAKTWLSVLESSGIVYLLRPYHRNFGKRLVKSPKLYFIDTGIAARLLGIKDAQQLFHHPNRGNLFESFVVSELLKNRFNRGFDPDPWFWRDNVGLEIDLIFEDGLTVKGLEIKSGKTFAPDFTAGLDKWTRYSGAKSEDCTIVYAGDMRLIWKGMAVLPWDTSEEFLALHVDEKRDD